ncbi:MAG: NAD(P)/FAD-dependent oxidoreductase [Calditrichaeota bacterium]|nr:MAG: NAD(P)/FAD-dependent oxidoreductase [Calditrichota bacterium]
MTEKYNIAIIGAGPAGIAAAAALLKKDPALKDEIIILEKAHHPRPKLCGGGLTPWADEMLDSLDLHVEVPSFQLESVAFYLYEKPIYFETSEFMRTIRRNEFDAALVTKIRKKGVTVIEGVQITEIHPKQNEVILESPAGTFSADIVIGADGVKSLVRRQLMREKVSRISRLLEVLIPIDKNQLTPEFENKMAVLDFTAIRHGLQGYIWDFPSFIDGEPYLNSGIFDARVNAGKRADLPALLQAHIQKKGINSDFKIEGCPERWYHPKQQVSCPRVVLTGDAAGIEPWLGEGISTALSYGPIVADAVFKALQTGDYSFSDYARTLKRTSLGWYLNRKRNVAQLIYRPGFYRLLPAFGHVLSWYMTLQNKQPVNSSNIK